MLEDLELARTARLLEQRAERLRGRKETAEEDGAWAAEFELGGQRYALPLERLRACLPLKGVAPVPLARRGVVGICRFEGKVVTVCSLATLLGVQGWRRDPAVLLLLNRGDGFLGLDCEEIPRSVQLPFSSLASATQASGALRSLSLPQPTGAPRLLHWIDPDLLLGAGKP